MEGFSSAWQMNGAQLESSGRNTTFTRRNISSYRTPRILSQDYLILCMCIPYPLLHFLSHFLSVFISLLIRRVRQEEKGASDQANGWIPTLSLTHIHSLSHFPYTQELSHRREPWNYLLYGLLETERIGAHVNVLCHTYTNSVTFFCRLQTLLALASPRLNSSTHTVHFQS